jgi:hypothetical protein
MKKLFFIFTLAVLFFSGKIRAQSLTLDTIAGFPDSVFDGQVIPLTLVVSNGGGTFFNSDLAILIHSDSSASQPDTMFYDTSYQLSNTLTDSIHITYTFNAADFEAGDNIVVVWPVSTQAPSMIDQDSLVFFLKFKNVGIGTIHYSAHIDLYPNPSGSQLHLRYSNPEKVEQVRVLDILGKELLHFDAVITRFNTMQLASGLYFVEVINKDGSHIVKKFFRE